MTAVLGVLLYASATQVLIENRAVPEWMKPRDRPEWVEELITYPRLFQGWSMFAPDPPREDGWVVVDGRTVDGRKLDPLTGQEPNFSLDLPYGPNLTAQWEAFSMRIFEKRFAVYHPGFQDYLENFDRISENPKDHLVAFDVWYVSRFIHPPGHGFSASQKRKLFSFGQVHDTKPLASPVPSGAAPVHPPPARGTPWRGRSAPGFQSEPPGAPALETSPAQQAAGRSPKH